MYETAIIIISLLAIKIAIDVGKLKKHIIIERKPPLQEITISLYVTFFVTEQLQKELELSKPEVCFLFVRSEKVPTIFKDQYSFDSLPPNDYVVPTDWTYQYHSEGFTTYIKRSFNDRDFLIETVEDLQDSILNYYVSGWKLVPQHAIKISKKIGMDTEKAVWNQLQENIKRTERGKVSFDIRYDKSKSNH